MSQETSVWLNTRTLIGFTDKRGTAWHYRADDQGDEPNHYEGPIPVADVRRRLFHWRADEGSIATSVITDDGVYRLDAEDRKAIVRPPGTFGADDPGAILGIFKHGYRVHNYDRWLVRNVESLLDDDLHVGSAGLLRGGAVAFVQVEVPDTITTPSGVAFRPFLSAATSMDGSLASTYLTGAQVVVCDNTLSAALLERDGKRVKVRHSRHSMGKLTEVRAALELVHTVADDFAAQVEELTNTVVSDGDWAKFLEELAPTREKGEEKTGRALTLARNKQDELNRLYHYDHRVAPWKGTAYGVVQAVNTFRHHQATVRGAGRVERNLLNMVTGVNDREDQATLEVLAGVTA